MVHQVKPVKVTKRDSPKGNTDQSKILKVSLILTQEEVVMAGRRKVLETSKEGESEWEDNKHEPEDNMKKQGAL